MSVLDDPQKKARIVAKVRSVLDDVTGDQDQDLGADPDGQIAGKLRSLLDDFTGDKDQDLAHMCHQGRYAQEQHGKRTPGPQAWVAVRSDDEWAELQYENETYELAEAYDIAAQYDCDNSA